MYYYPYDYYNCNGDYYDELSNPSFGISSAIPAPPPPPPIIEEPLRRVHTVRFETPGIPGELQRLGGPDAPGLARRAAGYHWRHPTWRHPIGYIGPALPPRSLAAWQQGFARYR